MASKLYIKLGLVSLSIILNVLESLSNFLPLKSGLESNIKLNSSFFLTLQKALYIGLVIGFFNIKIGYDVSIPTASIKS